MECASLQTDFCSYSSERGQGLPNWVTDCWSLRVTQKRSLLICILEPGSPLVHLGPTSSHPGARVPVTDQGLVFQWPSRLLSGEVDPRLPHNAGLRGQEELEVTLGLGWVDKEDMA